MTIDNKIRDEKLQYDINRAAAKISALSWSKIYKFEDLTCEEILPSDQSRMIEQVNSPLANTLEKEITTMENQAKKPKKQVEASLKVLKPVEQKFTIKDTIPEDRLKEEAKMTEKIKEIEKIVNRENLIYKTNKYVYNFQQFETIKFFAKNIFAGQSTLDNADKYQSNLLHEIFDFNKNMKPRSFRKKKQKGDTLDSINALFQGREMVINAF